MVLNGPNLNLLGVRNPEVYGVQTLADVERRCADRAAAHGLVADCRQSNHEGVLIDWVHEVRASCVGLVVNAGGYTHTSVALRDALETVEAPVIEVHISDIHAREPFRHHSYLEAVAAESIVGHGTAGYEEAIDVVARLLAERPV
ncbi:type II 3-dehydroquinate dehydratase [Arsenicicoccus dermatophilus]|uniref:type II 3-dehydroquinate dehydratase n=1 Tax=Arsenicicoccus dermatophilus TaxID=1076331 RepID=UPI0039173895